MIKKQIYSFKNAMSGLFWAVKTQRNFRIHLILSFFSIVGAVIFKVTYGEFLLILGLIGIGLAIEALNTAIEEAIDAIHKDWSDEIRIAKDASASAVLIFSICAFIIACLIFVPRILSFFNF